MAVETKSASPFPPKVFRIERVRRLLVETDMIVESIALECGYENGYYLSRVFSNKMKMSPSEYRRTHLI